MSVINTMLKDLERRGADSGDAGDKILGGISSASSPYRDREDESSNKAYLISLISMIVIIAVAISAYYFSPYKLVGIAKGSVEQVSTQADHLAVVKANKQTTAAKNELIAATSINNEQAAAAQKSADMNDAQVPGAHESAPKPQNAAVATVASTPHAAAMSAPKTASPAKQVASAPSSESKPVLQAGMTGANNTIAEQSDVADDVEENTATSLRVVTKQQRQFTPEEKSRQLYADAMSFYDQGNKQEAKSSLVQALTSNPGNADASRLLTLIYLEDGRADLASSTVEAGLKIHGTDQNLLRLYVQALVKLNKYSQAISVMGKRIQLTSPDDIGYLAGLYQKNNDHLEAIKYYSEALQLVPGKSIWWLGQGISLEIAKQYKESLVSYEKAVSTGQLPTKLVEYAISRIRVVKQHNADS